MVMAFCDSSASCVSPLDFMIPNDSSILIKINNTGKHDFCHNQIV
jgi:hypothetical protein